MPTQTLPFNLYAELLPNIRQITLYAEISSQSPSEASSAPRITYCDSHSTVSISYQDKTQSLRLPARVSSRHVLPDRLSPTKSTPGGQDVHEYSIRLQVDDSEPPDSQQDIHVPWTAQGFTPETRIRCRKCKNELFTPQPDRKVVWKDLPSADWAEMMDLWHCNKPDTHPDDREEDTDNEKVKGYGAANRVLCELGTVFVDVTSFVFAEGDCRGLKKDSSNCPSSIDDASKPPKSQIPKPIFCGSCDARVGEEQPSLNGVQLYKTNVSVSTAQCPEESSDSMTWKSLSVETIIASQLLVLIDRTGARRFILHPGDDNNSESGILIWVFNPSLRYSSSSGPTSAQRAMRVFYQPVMEKLQNMINPPAGAPASASVEDLPLPAGTYEHVRRSLERSNTILPHSARRLGDWRVGLVDVYEGE